MWTLVQARPVALPLGARKSPRLCVTDEGWLPRETKGAASRSPTAPSPGTGGADPLGGAASSRTQRCCRQHPPPGCALPQLLGTSECPPALAGEVLSIVLATLGPSWWLQRGKGATAEHRGQQGGLPKQGCHLAPVPGEGGRLPGPDPCGRRWGTGRAAPGAGAPRSVLLGPRSSPFQPQEPGLRPPPRLPVPPWGLSALPRVSSLERAVSQRDRALACLNEATNVSCTLLSCQEGPRPISCTTTTAWSRRELQDVLTATCRLENSSGPHLGRGWALCVQVLPGARASDPEAAGSAVTHAVPVDPLGPGGRREVTLALGPGEGGVLDLPVTVCCALFHGLGGALGRAPAPSGAFEDAPRDGGPPDTLPGPGGVCLPLSEHTVDLLQGLRFPGLAAPHARALGPSGPVRDPVDTFLEACCGPGSRPAGPSGPRDKHLPPSVAAITVSAELLRAAWGSRFSGSWSSLASLWSPRPEAGGPPRCPGTLPAHGLRSALRRVPVLRHPAVAARRERRRGRCAGPSAVLCPGRGPGRH